MHDFFYSVDHKQRIIQNIVLEFCEVSLEDKLKRAVKFKEAIGLDNIRCFIKGIFNGLA
jgi:hypothetical protein